MDPVADPITSLRKKSGSIPRFYPTAQTTHIAERLRRASHEENGNGPNELSDAVAMVLEELDKARQLAEWLGGEVKTLIQSHETLHENQQILSENQADLSTGIEDLKNAKAVEGASFNAYQNIGVWIISFCSPIVVLAIAKVFHLT